MISFSESKKGDSMIPTRVFYVVFRRIKDRYLLLKHDEAFEINEVGVRIWELCDGNRTQKEISQEIAQKYGIPDETAERDVSEFLKDMKNLGLIE